MEITEANPAEVPALVDLICRRVPAAPPAEAGWMWANTQDCYDLISLVARGDDGTRLGVGRLTSALLLPPTWQILNVTMSAEAEGSGVGRALYDALLARVRPDVDQLRVSVAADDERSMAVARHWGFEVVQTSVESSLDLTDPTRLPAPDPAAGVTLEDATAYDFGDRDAVAAMLLATQTHPEAVQGMVVNLDDLESTRKESPVSVLARVDGVPAGITLGFVEDGILFVDYTGVDPQFRGHGLALVLKQQLHLDGARLGATITRTNNAAQNTAIRQLNAALGYEATRSVARLRRLL